MFAASSRGSRRVAAGTALLLSAVLGLSMAPAASAGEPVPVDPGNSSNQAELAPVTKADRDLATVDEARRTTTAFFNRAAGTQTVFVRLAGDGAVSVAKKTATAQSRSAAVSRKAAIGKQTKALFDVVKAADNTAVKLYDTTNAIPGMVVRADAAALKKLTADPRVISIAGVVPKKLNNIGAVQTTKTLAEWQSTGKLGTGVSIGIIDTGIDYTHTDFGGPGTEAAYDAAGNSPAGTWETDKVVGGYDFAGDDYNADPDADPDSDFPYNPVPSPDADPLDCGDHGTHVAGTAAGYGVNADGTTFGQSEAAYQGLTKTTLQELKIGPGTAPMADLYGLRVFGCEGSTDLVALALDWSLDPNGDGNFADHLDVINMSLGSDYGVEDDPENAFVDFLADNGVMTVSAMGNAGDVTNIGGSPGNAIKGLAVANSASGRLTFDQIEVDAPASVAGIYNGQFSLSYDNTSLDLGPTPVVALSSANAQGCSPYSVADKAKVAGKVVWLEWPIDFACGSVARHTQAVAAGAVGIVMSSEEAIFSAGLTGGPTIPMFQFNSVGTEKLRPALEAGTLTVTYDGDLVAQATDVPELEDLINPSTSRGSNGALGVVKPDVAAPGTLISSAGNGTGDEALTLSGTSMATPHTAGIAALVREANPAWTVEQVKADIMNTANHDLWTGPGQTGDKYGPNRVGAGRVDAQEAVDNKVLVYAKNKAGAVSASFGIVEVPIDGAKVSKTITLVVQNTGTKTVTTKSSYVPAITQPGVSYAVSPATLSVPAKNKSELTVTMTVDPKLLKKTLDPTMDEIQADYPRQFIADASGRVLVRPVGLHSLRVPVYGAAKPVSTTTAIMAPVDGVPSVVLSGSGTGYGNGDASFGSLFSVYQLGGTSPRLPRCSVDDDLVDDCSLNATTDGTDLRQVGVNSNYHDVSSADDTDITFAVNTWRNHANFGPSFTPFVDIWTDPERDVPNFELFVSVEPDTDVFDVLVYAFDEDGGAELVNIYATNWVDGDVDTNLFNSSVVLLPVGLADLYPDGIPADASFEYSVGTASYLNGYIDPEGDSTVDSLPADGSRFTFNPTDPDLYTINNVPGAADQPFYADRPGTALPIGKSANADTDKLMVVHQQGPTGQNVDILSYSGKTPVYSTAVQWMLDSKIATGTPSTFKGTGSLAKSSMAAFLYRFAHPSGNAVPKAPKCTTKPFTDIPVTYEFCGEIAWLKSTGIVKGSSGGKVYGLTDVVTRATMASVLRKMAAVLDSDPGTTPASVATCVASSGFSDVSKTTTVCGDIRWLTAETGLGGGYPDATWTTFKAGSATQRQMLAQYLYRFEELIGRPGQG